MRAWLRPDKEVRAHSAYGPDPSGLRDDDERYWANRLTCQPRALGACTDEPSIKLEITTLRRWCRAEDAVPLGCGLLGNVVEKYFSLRNCRNFRLPLRGALAAQGLEASRGRSIPC